ncbi:MAG: NAD-dependent succinate-semialdehyde dehydrogenase [Nocardioidaceae bacterium]|nr:NAD-dependent succinate-semialdehyde dehydrogenase [Nocardioidaceae bacterium]
MTSYVGGQWLRGGGGDRPVLNPVDGSVLATVATMTDEECDAAVEAAAQAQQAWAARPARERGELLRRVWEILVAETEDLARLITLENGKSLADARGEAAYAAEFFRWFAEEAVRTPGDMRRSPAGKNWILVSHEPVGVALLVTPWNFPAAMATRKIAPALAAGCTVVLKPAMETPLAALYVADVVREAGIPDGVVNVVLPRGTGPAVARMMADPRVRAISFTGSTEVGKILLEQAAKSVMRSSMELGGNAPFVVLEDADLDAAVEGFMLAKFRNGGSACTAANRILVQDGVAEEFVTRIQQRIEDLRVGPGLAEETQVGPLVSAVERDRVADLVDRAVAAGATLRVGGTRPEGDGYYYPPTLLDHVDPASELATTEIFGPVAAVTRFGTVEEGLALANDSEAGLVSYVYTGGLEQALAVSRRLESGMVGLNCGLVSDPAAPFGGSKESGLGREGAHEGMLEFMETKYVATPYA